MTDFIPDRRSLVNKRNGAAYEFVAACLVQSENEQITNLINICNEPQIYELFRTKYAGRPYGESDAKRFLTWADDGWSRRTHFVFVLLDGSGKIVSAMDIKSADRNMTEVGYWCSSHHGGMMTEALEMLISVAMQFGYRNLYARVRKDNVASLKVLQNNGFSYVADWPNDSSRARYQLSLKS